MSLGQVDTVAGSALPQLCPRLSPREEHFTPHKAHDVRLMAPLEETVFIIRDSCWAAPLTHVT